MAVDDLDCGRDHGAHGHPRPSGTPLPAGELWLELDNGQQHVVRAGDTLVQNGTRHAWRNKSEHPCVMAVALIGAARHN